ncbi:orotate phosphoribosyltransferase [candidate division KSB1 bacterium]|nr:orotate phosphoribosyltransferase [candidate division KSB1 bacterium]
MEKQEILNIFRQSKALLEGHFLLSSGLHSPQYFQCARVLQYPQYTERLCSKIADHYRHKQVSVVIAPAIGGIVIAQEVGRLLGVRSMFAEREQGKMTLRRGFQFFADDHVLVVEDVVTTGGSVKEVVGLVEENDVTLAGVGYIVDRSAGKVRFNPEGFSLLTMDVITYTPDECPLCSRRIPLVKPGSRDITKSI